VTAEAAIAATFVAYVVGMLAVGVLAYRRTRSLSDYILGGRRLGSFATALSAQASDMSGWLLLGLPGAAYATGLESIWIAVGLLVGTLLNWLVVAKRLRRATEECGDALTVSAYLENRFNDRSHLLRWVSGLFILIFFLIYTTSGLVAGGKLFNAVFGMNYRWAVLVGAVAIISYTCIGGFTAVCWTDCVQGLLMLLALVVVSLAAVNASGGADEAGAAIRRLNPHLLDPLTKSDGTPLTFLGIVSLLGWGLGYFGQPHILARFMAIKSEKRVFAAGATAMVWVTICMTAAVLVGLAGVGLFETEPLEDKETVFIGLVRALLHPVPAGICLAAILAAIMSTADSQLLVCSSVLTEDFWKALFKRRVTPETLVVVGRTAVVVMAIIAAALAMDPESVVLKLVSYAWGGLGAAFGPIIIMSLLWKRTTRNGALAGIVAGGSMVIIWHHRKGGIFELYELVPAFVFSLLVIIAMSLAGTRRGDLDADRS